jgi:hypothetical protein
MVVRVDFTMKKVVYIHGGEREMLIQEYLL